MLCATMLCSVMALVNTGQAVKGCTDKLREMSHEPEPLLHCQLLPTLSVSLSADINQLHH